MAESTSTKKEGCLWVNIRSQSTESAFAQLLTTSLKSIESRYDEKPDECERGQCRPSQHQTKPASSTWTGVGESVGGFQLVLHAWNSADLLFLSRNDPSRPQLTSNELRRIGTQKTSQLDAWLREPQTHEQLAVGERTRRAGGEIAQFFQDIEKNVQNDGRKGWCRERRTRSQRIISHEVNRNVDNIYDETSMIGYGSGLTSALYPKRWCWWNNSWMFQFWLSHSISRAKCGLRCNEYRVRLLSMLTNVLKLHLGQFCLDVCSCLCYSPPCKRKCIEWHFQTLSSIMGRFSFLKQPCEFWPQLEEWI